MYLENGKAVKQIFAEMSLGNLFGKIAVGGGNDTDVDLYRTCIANLDELAGFQDTQQLGLQVESHFTDLVKEDSAVVGLLEKSFRLLQSTRESACFMTEHLALQQVAAERRAVDSHKGFSAARTVLMDGLGEDFLSGACLACQQHGYIGLRHLAGQGDRLLYGGRFADDGVERILPADRRNGSFLLTVGGGGFLHSFGDQGEDFIVVVAFGDIIESTVLDGLHAVGDIAVGGQ